MTSKRGPYSSEKQRERRRRILKVAGVQLQKHGLDALTMQSIAEVSEVSTKTLYNLFGSRDLLLLEAASDRLVDLETSSELNSIEAGIPRLLAFTIGTMAQFEEMPKYARAVIAIVMRASMDEETAYQNLTPVQRFAHASLVIADKQGELRDGIDLLELSYVIAANLWGVVMLWEKGLLQLEQLKIQIALSHSLALTPLCVGERKVEMEARLEKLLNAQSATPVKKTKKKKAAVKLVSNNKR
ncbi:MAG: TetR/AcrR family transcriptional regulator [Halioglobus sp.]